MGMSRGNLDKIYKKDALNTDLLAKLCVLLKFDFFEYVNPFKMAGEPSETQPKFAHEDFSDYMTPKTRLEKCHGELTETRRELDQIEKEVVMLRRIVEDKTHIIQLLENGKVMLEERIASLKGMLNDLKNPPSN